MKRILLLAIFAVIGIMVQAQIFQWAKQFNGGGNSAGYALAHTNTGDLYVAGSFEGTIDFDPGDGTFFLTAFGNRDAYVTKMDASGNFIWAKQIGGTDADYILNITLDPAGNVYLIGSFKGTADMDPGDETYIFTSLGGEDMFVTELDEHGDFIWAGQMGGNLDDHCTDIIIPPSGEIYIAGYFLGTADFDPAETGDYYLTASGQAIFVEKLNSDHTFSWAKTMGGPGFDYCAGMCLDEDENVYTTGMFMGPADFDPGDGTFILNSVGDRDIFISKLNSDGEYVWAIEMGGPLLEAGQGICYDDNGSIYVAGNFQGTVDFGSDANPYYLTSFGGYDIFTGKLDVDGNLLWMKQMGGLDNQSGYALTLDNNGNVYTTGLFEGTANFNPGDETYEMTSFGDYDVFVSKLDVSGNFVWAADMGGSLLDRGMAISTDDQTNIFTTGWFTETADFDPSENDYLLIGTGEYNAFVSKLDTDILGNQEIHDMKMVSVHPNPTNDDVNLDLNKSYTEISVSIFDLKGQKILQKTFSNQSQLKLELPDAKGLYFIKMVHHNNGYLA